MIKISLLATLFASLAMGTVAAKETNQTAEKRDARIIVEVNRSLESLTSDGIKNTQNIVLNNIKRNVTSNVRLISSYSVLNNAFAISINSEYIPAVRNVPGVKSVTVDELHFKDVMSQAILSDSVDPEHDYGGKDNASAETMNLEENTTNDGEGTVIAILDNEFYFRGKTDTADAWYHETFTDLDESVNVRFTSRPAIGKTHAYEAKKSEIKTKDHLGEEGSLYFNRKIPYYFDYGGEREYYGGDYNEDFDVSSTISYHGSHVASIASGNSPYYKGIAPKAQLVCMKVFTNFEASKVDLAMGFQNSSGAYDIPILNALEDCITLGVDGINMSLGSNLDDFDAKSITRLTLGKLAAAGILSSISAGNSGKSSYAFAGGYGNWTSDMVETGILSGYANSPESMTVASGHPNRTFFKSAFKYDGRNISYQDQVVNVGNSSEYEEDEEHRISDLISGSTTSVSWTYIPNFGNSSDYTGKDVTGKIAIVNRGNIDFATKVSTAKDKGAIGVVIINNDPTSNDFNFRCSFGDLKPTIPVALVLFKDKKTFETAGSGTFTIVKDEVDENPRANTLSTFSSDGATYDLDFKPDITAPGDNIRGAIPPQDKDDKKDRPLSTYEFLSGTSMSAPNYAGAQSVVLSKKAVELKDNQAEYVKYRKTVDMRLMSTAHPMVFYDEAPEVNENYPSPVHPDASGQLIGGYQSSPRIQGAGMADIGSAYKTKVYLEGMDLQGNGIGKSKIALRNNKDINNGTINLSFLAHNESNETLRYMASYSVMRPAIKNSNEIIARNYNYRGEVDSISSFSGMSYWVEEVDIHGTKSIKERHATGDVEVGDVFKVSREIKYNVIDPEDETKLKEVSFPIGRYACTEITAIVDHDGETWKYAKFEEYESSKYQSTQDYLIKLVTVNQEVSIAPGTSTITLPSYSLTNEEREEIADFYKYGCYLEGFVSLVSISNDEPALNIPYMGFYGGEGNTYESAPIAEPFNFEKDNTTIYPSELVNDIGYNLLGKTNIDMGSTWVTTFVEPGKDFKKDDILSNDESLSHLARTNANYHFVGADTNGNYYEDAANNIYVGDPHSSNTMLIQLFMLRSVDDNYFTISNKETGKVVYTDALEDMLFGDRYDRHPLYKSHVDDSYLGGGYVAHRAWGVIPLYDLNSGESFEAGEYEITFNYKLAATGNWFKQSYTLHVTGSEPSITKVENRGETVRFHYSEPNLVSVKVGSNFYEMSDAELEGNYIELEKDRLELEIENNMNEVYGSGRLYIELLNKAHGRTGALVRFEEKDGELDFSKWIIVEHYSFNLANDFEDLGDDVEFVTYNASTYQNTIIDVDNYVQVKRYNDKPKASPSKGGCSGNIATTSILLSSLAGLCVLALLISKRRRLNGGK